MALVLRLDKGSSLDFTELDGNFTYLDGRIDTNAANISTNTTNISTNTTNITNLQGSRVTTSSYNAFTGSVTTTSSFNSFTSSVVTTSSFNSLTGSVITTGSASLKQSITGSLTVSSSLKVIGKTEFTGSAFSTKYIGTQDYGGVGPALDNNYDSTSDIYNQIATRVPAFPFVFDNSDRVLGSNTVFGVDYYYKDICIGYPSMDVTGFSKLSPVIYFSKDPASTAPYPKYMTVLSDNTTVTIDAVNAGIYTKNGRNHVLTVTGSFLCLDGVSIGSSWTDRHIVTGSLRAANITGSLFGSSSYSLTASYALNGGVGSALTSFIATGSVSASVDVKNKSFEIISGSNTLLSINNLGGTSISGSLLISSSNTEFEVVGTGVKIGRSATNNHGITGSLFVDNTLYVTESRVGVATGTTSPISSLQVNGSITVGQNGGNENQAVNIVRPDGSSMTGISGTGTSTIQIGGANVGFVDVSASDIVVAKFNTFAAGPGFAALNLRGPLWISGSGYTGNLDYMLDVSGSGVSGDLRVNNTLFVSSSRVTVTGSLSVRNGITGSLQGTSSWAQNSVAANNGGVTSISNGYGISISSGTGAVTITNNKPYNGPGYDQLLYVFSQTGSNDPGVPSSPGTVPVFDKSIVNTTGHEFTFTRTNAGEYTLTADSPILLQDRTAIYLSPGQNFLADFACSYEWISATTIIVYSTLKDGTPSDENFKNTTLDIRIYPA